MEEGALDGEMGSGTGDGEHGMGEGARVGVGAQDREGRRTRCGRWGKDPAGLQPKSALAAQEEPDHPQGPARFPSLGCQDLLETPTGLVEAPQAGAIPD